MEAAKRLAGSGERSEIARTARSGLIGLRASLADAIARCPQDQGRVPALELIGQLDTILAAWPAPGNPIAAEAAEPPPGPGRHHTLIDLAAAFARDPAVTEYLDEQSLATLTESPDSDTVWRALHLCLLRLPEQAATGWRARLAVLAGPAGATDGWLTLPAEREAILVPRRPGLSEVTPAVGVRTSAGAAVDPEVLAALGRGGGEEHLDHVDTAELARLSSLVLGLTELDDNLVLCLESVLFMGSRRLDGKYRRLYRADLLGRLGEYARREPGSAGGLEALVEIDEAVNSLTHRPPTAAGSWWAQLRQQSRRMVERTADALREAGVDVEILPLGLRYRDVRDFTAGNDVASRTGGKPGDVLACLRLWARIGDRTLPGRVMYRA